MARDDFYKRLDELPEPKIELLDGKLCVGNGAGNLQLLKHLVDGWGAQAALPMAAPAQWWQALHLGFMDFQPPAPDKPAAVWHAWAAQLSYAPILPPAGPMVDGKHRGVRQTLHMGLFGLARENRFAHVIGRDVIMKLGTDAHTPDVFLVGPDQCRGLNDHYHDGPADLVMEVLLKGHERWDLELKRQKYEAGRIPEYWIVDPYTQSVQILRLDGTTYRVCQPQASGVYTSLVFPGLRFHLEKLWERNESFDLGDGVFSLHGTMPRVSRGFAKDGVAWGDLRFDPCPALEPQLLSFREFAAWAPEAKFELIDGKPWIGGTRGARNVLGMLLRTEGLARAVTVLHPREWIAELIQMAEERSADQERRRHWWQVAREAAAELREKFGFAKLSVIGDLLGPQPLNVWSDITLVAQELPKGRDTWEASHFLYKKYRDEPDINLLSYEHATSAEREALAGNGVEV